MNSFEKFVFTKKRLTIMETRTMVPLPKELYNNLLIITQTVLSYILVKHKHQVVY